MKQLQLDLNKRLLIVEYDEKIEIESVLDVNPDFETGVLKEKKFIAVPGNLKFICKGSDLTEDIAKEFVHQSIFSGLFPHYVKDIPVNAYCHKTALESFDYALRAYWFHWGENPVEEPKQEKYGWYSSCSPEEESGWMYEEGESKYYEALKYYKDAESRTFNPEKCIIFKLL